MTASLPRLFTLITVGYPGFEPCTQTDGDGEALCRHPAAWSSGDCAARESDELRGIGVEPALVRSCLKAAFPAFRVARQRAERVEGDLLAPPLGGRRVA